MPTFSNPGMCFFSVVCLKLHIPIIIPAYSKLRNGIFGHPLSSIQHPLEDPGT